MKLALIIGASVLLSGCVTREIVRTVEVPAPAPVQGSTISVKQCVFIVKLGNKTSQLAGSVKLLQRTDGTFIQLYNGNILPVEETRYDEKNRDTVYLVSNQVDANTLNMGMAFACH